VASNLLSHQEFERVATYTTERRDSSIYNRALQLFGTKSRFDWKKRNNNLSFVPEKGYVYFSAVCGAALKIKTESRGHD